MLLEFVCEKDQLESPATEAHSGPRILVVDDSGLSRQFVGQLLQGEMGATPIYAGDGPEALEIIASDPPAAIVTDLVMPVLDGHELVMAVHDRFPHIPVILITAHGSEEIAMRALQAGAASYVPKRALTRDLVPTVARVLQAVEGRRTRRRLQGFLRRSESTYCLENDPALIAPLVQAAQEQLASLGMCDEGTRMRVGVAMQEALGNALYHGNLECSTDLRQDDERLFYGLADRRRGVAPYRDRRIWLTARYEPDQASFTIRDEGPGFDTGLLEREIQPEDVLRVGGRGLLLIRTFMDAVAFNARGNEIRLVKRFLADG